MTKRGQQRARRKPAQLCHCHPECHGSGFAGNRRRLPLDPKARPEPWRGRLRGLERRCHRRVAGSVPGPGARSGGNRRALPSSSRVLPRPLSLTATETPFWGEDL